MLPTSGSDRVRVCVPRGSAAGICSRRSCAGARGSWLRRAGRRGRGWCGGRRTRSTFISSVTSSNKCKRGRLKAHLFLISKSPPFNVRTVQCQTTYAPMPVGPETTTYSSTLALSAQQDCACTWSSSLWSSSWMGPLRRRSCERDWALVVRSWRGVQKGGGRGSVVRFVGVCGGSGGDSLFPSELGRCSSASRSGVVCTRPGGVDAEPGEAALRWRGGEAPTASMHPSSAGKLFR